MIRRLLAITLIALCVLHASPRLDAWGFDAHRYVTGRALDMLPAEIKPFFEKHRAFIVEHSVDPDLWRNAGFEDEPPRHFVDMDAYGPPPFTAVPRDFDAAVATHGKDFVLKNGTLPWRGQEFYDKLVKAFDDVKAGRPYALDNVSFYAAVLSHYAGDAHVPFHAALNYDGQLTQQHGIHARFESDLYARARERLTVAPAPLTPVPATVRDYFFDTLAASYAFVEGILAADKAAIGQATEYDDAYFAKFETGARPVLEKRLANSITAVASLITRAWEQAGKPELPVNPVRTVRKRRLPGA